MSAKTNAPAKPATSTAVAPVSTALPGKLLDSYKGVIAKAQEEAAAMTRADYSMPFIGVVQSLSPQRDKTHAKYIEGAEEGDFFNTVTSELFKADVGIDVIPVRYELVFNVWRPREQGGGFVGSCKTQDEAVAIAVAAIQTELRILDPVEAKQVALSRDKTGWVRDTMNQYVLIQEPDGSWIPVLLSLTSTKLTPSRKWNTMISLEKPTPGRVAIRWNKVWHVGTTSAKNQEGQSYYTILPPKSVRETSELEWAQAADFFQMLEAGAVKVEYEKSQEASTETTEDAGPAM